MGSDTTIGVSNAVADELHSRKQRGESYDDLLRRMLDMEDPDAQSVN